MDLSIAAVDCAPQVAAALTDPAMLFAQAALRAGVAVVPGRLLSATGQASEYIRLAFTQPPHTLTRAALALAQAATATRPRSAPSSA